MRRTAILLSPRMGAVLPVAALGALRGADRVLAEFKDTGAHLASSNLSSEQEAKLREVFAEDEAPTPTG